MKVLIGKHIRYTNVLFLSFSLLKYGKFIDNLRLFARGGSGGMGFPRLGGEGGNGGDVWVVAHKKMTLKQLKDKYPQKRFVAGEGANSRWVFIEWLWFYESNPSQKQKKLKNKVVISDLK